VSYADIEIPMPKLSLNDVGGPSHRDVPQQGSPTGRVTRTVSFKDEGDEIRPAK